MLRSISSTLPLLGAALVVVTVVALLAAYLVVRTVRARRAQRRADEARRREEASRQLVGGSGALALAGTIEGLRLASLVARAGAEVGRRGLAPALAGSLRLLADYAESDRPAIKRVLAEDGSVVLMFSDIEGSTALNQQLGDEGWLELLQVHDTIVRRRVRTQHGQVIKTHGDSFMVAFKELSRALNCAVEIQRDLEDREVAGEPAIRVRIGLHCGEVTRQGRDIFGLNVALAARVAAEASGGEVLVSSDVKRLARDAGEFNFGRPRTVQLKGISEETTVYPLRWAAS